MQYGVQWRRVLDCDGMDALVAACREKVIKIAMGCVSWPALLKRCA